MKCDRKTAALLPALVLAASLVLVSCGGGGPTITKPPSGVTTRVLASQSVASPTAAPGLVIIDGEIDARLRAAEINTGGSPGLMAISPDRTTLLAFDSVTNSAEVVSTPTEVPTGSIQLGGPTTSMVVLNTGFAYAAVPAASFTGPGSPPPGAVVAMNLAFNGSVVATLSVPNAQTVVSSPDGTKLLVFSGDAQSLMP